MIALNLRCPVHPRYKAIYAPRTKACAGCNCAGIWSIAQWARGIDVKYNAPIFTRLIVHSCIGMDRLDGYMHDGRKIPPVTLATRFG
jgi:hypothetical protein